MASKIVPPERIGFIGLGNMGGPMARRLAAAGYKLSVFDASGDAVQRFAKDTDCETPKTFAELAKSCRVVITMLPDGYIVRNVLLGDKGVVSGLAKGSILIDMSSSSPVGTRETAAGLAKRGFPLIDAPVSGGVRKAVDGTLAIMAGGDADLIEQCRDLLSTMGKVFVAGSTGCGHAMKSLNNFLSAINLASAAEAVIAGQRFGLDPKVMVEIFNASTGKNSATEQKYPAYILTRTFNSGFFMGLMAKDLRLALELAQSTHSPSTLLGDTKTLWEEAEGKYGFRSDSVEVVRYLEELAESSDG
jgi:3-hydroxyisobutyrate dehydrogenase